MTLLPGDPRHGTPNGYNNHRCRCELCKTGWAASVQERKLARPMLAPDDPRHGTCNAYGNFSCRCRLCIDAWTKETIERNARRAHREGKLWVQMDISLGRVDISIEWEPYGTVFSTGERTRYWTAHLLDGTIVRPATKGPRYKAVDALVEHWKEAHGVRTGDDLVHGSH